MLFLKTKKQISCNDKERCMNEQDNSQEGREILQNLQEQHGFEIIPCDVNMEFDEKNGLEMLRLTPEQKMQVGELLRHVPAAAAAGVMAGAYKVSFPKGLPHTLMRLGRGGFGSQIVGRSKGILGSASFYPMAAQAAVLGVFTAMSIATGQFFLMQINKELHMINKKLDEILKFLHEEKEAELLSEVIFVKYACDNYGSIMANEAQRTATIGSIQEAKKIAMKDIEFYLKYLKGKIESGARQNFKTLVDLMDGEIMPNMDNLDMSLQLYLMGSLMEVYYAQNFENSYIDYIKESIRSYVKNCSQQCCSVVDQLEAYFKSCKIAAKEDMEFKERKKTLGERKLAIGARECEMARLYDVLNRANKRAEFYIMEDGSNCNVYYKAS